MPFKTAFGGSSGENDLLQRTRLNDTQFLMHYIESHCSTEIIWNEVIFVCAPLNYLAKGF